ncbi:MAG: hypothetical protein JRI99_07480 [Deltaproteobacteria bacterium]|nr:hypothetical protein [Deltaproteobacteria bacterium]
MMIEIAIPGYRKLKLDHLVMDYNGTLAVDGKITDGVKECLEVLAENLQLHVITADTFGKVRSALKGVSCELSILPVNNQDVGMF